MQSRRTAPGQIRQRSVREALRRACATSAGLFFAAPWAENAGLMIEIMIERWSAPEGTEFRWSLWRDGVRIEMGPSCADADEAEAAAEDFCVKTLGRTADRVTRL
jgi:hypothetical protein